MDPNGPHTHRKALLSGIPRDTRIAAFIALAAAGLFALQILTISQEEASQFSKYPYAAGQWLNGTAAPERLTDYSPLYLWLHGAAHGLLAEPLRWMHVLHIVLLSLTASLLYLILRRFSGRAASLAGAAAFVLGRSVIVYGYIFEPEPLMIFLLTSVVYFAEFRSVPGVLATGTALSLCLLTRPTFAPLVLIIPVYYWLQARDRGSVLRSILLFAAPVLITLAFISFRNYGLQQNASPLGMNPALRFYDGNNPLADGNRAAYPPLVNDVAGRSTGESDYEYAVYRQFARTDAGRDLSVGETERYWASKTSNFIHDHPAHFLSLTARRIFYLFHSYRWHDLDPSWLTDRVLGRRAALFVPFSLVSALALFGMVLGLGAWRQHLLPYLIFLNQAGFMALIYATDRQRVCLYPFFILFAALALSKLIESGRSRAPLAAGALLLTVLFAYPLDRMKDDTHIGDGTARIPALLEQSSRDLAGLDHAGALKRSSQAFALWPRNNDHVWFAGLPGGSAGLAEAALGELPSLRRDSPSTRLDRALLLTEAGRLDEAERILASLAGERHAFLRDGDSLPDPLFHLGHIEVLRGRHDRAVDYMRRALEQHPGDPVLLSYLACLTGDRAYADTVVRYFDAIDAAFYLGRACLDAGRPEQARASFDRLTSYLPDNPRARVYHAAALSASGRYAEAAAAYRDVAGERPGTVMLEEWILSAFEREARRGEADAVYWYGVVLRHYGYYPKALHMMKKAAGRGHPGAAASARELEVLFGGPDGRGR